MYNVYCINFTRIIEEIHAKRDMVHVHNNLQLFEYFVFMTWPNNWMYTCGWQYSIRMAIIHTHCHFVDAELKIYCNMIGHLNDNYTQTEDVINKCTNLTKHGLLIHRVFHGLLNIIILVGLLNSPYQCGRYCSWLLWQPSKLYHHKAVKNWKGHW